MTVAKVFMVSNFAEYAVLLLNLVIVVAIACYQRRRKQNDPAYRAYMEKKKAILVMKEPASKLEESNQNMLDEESKVEIDFGVSESILQENPAPISVNMRCADSLSIDPESPEKNAKNSD